MVDDIFAGRVGISMPYNMTEVLTVNGDLSCRSTFNMYDQLDTNNSNPYTIMCQSNVLYFKNAIDINGDLSVKQKIIFTDEVFGDSMIQCEYKEIDINDNSLRFTDYGINANDSLFCQNGITAINGHLYCTQNDYFMTSNIDPESDLDYINNLNVNAGFNDSNLQSFEYMINFSSISNLNSMSKWTLPFSVLS